MEIVHLASHVVVCGVIWFALSIVIGAYLFDEDSEAMGASMFLSALVCLFVLGIIYW